MTTTTHKFEVEITTESAAPPTRDQEEDVINLLTCGLRQPRDDVRFQVRHYRVQIPGTERVSECSLGGYSKPEDLS